MGVCALGPFQRLGDTVTTPLDVSTLDALHAETTQGEWTAREHCGETNLESDAPDAPLHGLNHCESCMGEANAKWIAAIHNAWPEINTALATAKDALDQRNRVYQWLGQIGLVALEALGDDACMAPGVEIGEKVLADVCKLAALKASQPANPRIQVVGPTHPETESE